MKDRPKLTLIDGVKINREVEVEKVIEFAPKRAEALRRIAREQVGVPTQIRLELAASAVTIETMVNEVAFIRDNVRAFLTTVGIAEIAGLTEQDAISKVFNMILLSHEAKLKLQELYKEVKAMNSARLGRETNSEGVLTAAEELCEVLPPEVTEGV